jgi:alpha-ketoglutarate-dependent taurine dioxygenase
MRDADGAILSPEVARYTARQLLFNNGYVVIREVPTTFDHPAFLSEFGRFLPTPTGALIGDLRPEPDMDGVYHAQNRLSLVPHTEGYEYDPEPPRYMALWCVTPPAGEGGETTLADGYAFLETLSQELRDHLAVTKYEWKLTDGLKHRGVSRGNSINVPLEDIDGVQKIRFSCNNMLIPDDDALGQQYIERGLEFYETHHVGLSYEARDMVIWDNWRFMHSRNAFSDPKRHLKRVQIA